MKGLKNRVQLIGVVQDKLEIRKTRNGKRLSFRLAMTMEFRDENGEKVTSQLENKVIAWGRLAELAEKRINIGSEVLVGGILVNRSYLENGIRHDVAEVEASDFWFVNDFENIFGPRSW